MLNEYFLQSNELNALFKHEQISNSNGKNIRKYTIYYNIKYSLKPKKNLNTSLEWL